ncbi:ATP-binding protein [Burkholderia sp. PU8-34]
MRDVTKSILESGRITAKLQQHLSYIRHDWRIRHKIYDETRRRLNAHITVQTGRQPVLLVGPTATGKTTLMRETDAELVQLALADGKLVYGSGYTPLNSPVMGRLDVDTLYQDILRHALEPLVDYKIAYPPDIRDGAPVIKVPNRSSRAGMMQSIEKAIGMTYSALFFDDASSWAQLLKAARALEAPNVFKDISNKAPRCGIVVSGGPEVVSFIWKSDQHAARFRPVWMPPYRLSIRCDVHAYWIFLNTLESKLGPDYIVPGTLTRHCREIMLLCWGTVGITIDMVLASVIISLQDGQPLEWKTLKKHLLEFAEISNQTMKAAHDFFFAAQKEDTRPVYFSYLKYFQQRRKTDASDDPELPAQTSSDGRTSSADAKSVTPSRKGVSSSQRDGGDVREQAPSGTQGSGAGVRRPGTRAKKPERSPLSGGVAP